MSLTGVLRCLICDHERETFLCDTCIREGNFASSKKTCELTTKPVTKRSCKHGGKTSSLVTPVLAKFSEKKARLRTLEDEYKIINDRFELIMADSKRKESLEQAIIEHKSKINSIRKLIAYTRMQLAIADERSKRTDSVIMLQEKKRKKSIDEMTTLHRSIVKVTGKLAKANAEFERVRLEIREETQEKMLQLKDGIFPFWCKKGSSNSTTTNSFDENYSSKENSLFISESETDSFSTTCCPPSMGSWANVESNCLRYYVVEPWIPKYSVSQGYINWVNKIQEAFKPSPLGEPDSDDQYIKKNDAYRISAALSFITQFLELASFVTDVSFPKRLGFVEFHSKFDKGTEIFLTENEILHKVAKLNVNLIHLCLTQKVDGRILVPTYTGQNLSLLFDPNFATYNRSGQIYIDTESHRRIEEALYSDYNLVEPTETEFIDDSCDEYIGSDWESVTSAQVVTPYENDLYASQSTTTSLTSGIMSSAVNVISSFMRKK